MPTSTRVRALLGAAVLGGGLLLAPGLASAQTPAPTCADYPTQPDAQAAFIIERDRLAVLDPDGNSIACEELPAVLPARVAALAGEDGDATSTTSTTSTTPTTTTTSAALAASSADDLLTQIAALQCGTTYFPELASIRTASSALDSNLSPVVNNAALAKEVELNYCIATSDVVNSTIDDGSVPITDGGQVSIVPEGSAETGEA